LNIQRAVKGGHMTAQEKCEEIIALANKLNRSLLAESREGLLREGGNLLLGRYYAESPTIYLSLNPGSYGTDKEFVPDFDGKSGRNPPFDSSDNYIQGRQGSYGRNWRRFLADNPRLYDWFNDKVTSTFLCPWRTGDARKLKTLDKSTGGKLYDYSSRLVWKMIEHHNAKLLIIAGLASVHLFNEMYLLREHTSAWNYRVIDAAVRGTGKQYAEHELKEKGITVLQIPHFSARGRGSPDLRSLSEWLRIRLREFGLKD